MSLGTNSIDKLNEYKSKLDSAKLAKAKKEGERDSLIQQLKSEYGITDISNIDKILSDMKIKKDKLFNDINAKLEEIEKGFDWDSL